MIKWNSIFLAFLTFCCCSGFSLAHPATTNMESIKADFLNPPSETRPGCYWYWINDNISKEGITKDLEAMQRVGIGRAYIGHIYNHLTDKDTPVGDVKFMSDQWWQAVQWAVKEADRCGVEIGFFNSPGWSQSGGPWVKPSQSMRYLTHSETIIEGGKKVDQIIQPPKITTGPEAGGSNPKPTGPKFTQDNFQDVRVIAFKKADATLDELKVSSVKSDQIKEINKLFDGNEETIVTFPANKQIVIDAIVDEHTAEKGVQSLIIKLLDDSFNFRCIIEASQDGNNYNKIITYTEQRGHQGPKRKEKLLIPFELTKAKHFRLKLHFSPNRRHKSFRVANITLSAQAVIASYVRKQLGETSPSTQPNWNSYIWQELKEPLPGSSMMKGDVIDISRKMDKNGRLVWNAPKGTWVILRMGMVPIGTSCHPASPEAVGLEVDKMNEKHVRSLFDGMVGEFLKRTPAKDRKALKYIIADSYETGPQNWTDDFIRKFTAKFKYSPVRFLPVLTGRIVDSAEISERFLWDLRRIIVEEIAYGYVGGLREVCNENNLTLWLENYGHWGYPSEFLLYGSQSNQVGGEFWVNGIKDNIECRAASSCGRTYGKNDIYAESFTSGHNFKFAPGSLKKWCDWLYGTGVNHLILHVNIHQPDERKPGIIQWFGTSFNRHNTWFEQSKPFIDYSRRSSVLLKAGKPVIDIAYYIGENGPMMTGPRNPALPDGYDFDFINSDALINRTKVKDGKLIVKDGPAYSVLVLPRQKIMRPQVAKAIKKLARNGATIVGPKPVKSPSLQNYPACDREVAKIADNVWGNVDGGTTKKTTYGKGIVYDGVSLEQVFNELNLKPDVKVISDDKILCAAAGGGKIGIGKNGGIVFQHRDCGDADIYFLANTSVKDAELTASLRIAGRKPAFWDSVTGDIRQTSAFSQNDGRTLIPLHLEDSESIFIVFDGKIDKTFGGIVNSNEPEYKTVASLNGKWTVRFNGQGAPENIIFDELSDWTNNSNEAIKYYSGTGVYEKNFTLDKSAVDKPLVLNLGHVGVIAKVIINGKEAGIVWAAPWQIDISGLAVAGNNQLQIQVTNLWNNRLVADSKLPPEKRQANVSQPYRFKESDPLCKGGLLGPVIVKQEQ